jgi:hypothetical protein
MTPPTPDWHPEVLPDRWSQAAADLTTLFVLDGFYLAGGTGLALQLGHRRSVDLDLFRESEFASADLRDRMRSLDGLQKLETARGTVHAQLHDVKISFLHYPYPLLFGVGRFEALDVADPRDIACMKLEAVANRGSRRDFVDLYLAATIYGLPQLLDWFGQKYASARYSRTHLFKALTYFADAETDPMPEMFVPLEWPTVVQYFQSEAPRLTRLG